MSNDETSSSVDSESLAETVSEPGPPRKRSLISRMRSGALLRAAAMILIITARNWEPVSIDVMGQKVEVALSVLVILTFLCGTVTGLLLAYFRPWRKQD